jgi:hypothetical protein
MRVFIVLAMVVCFFVPQVWADCKADCQNDYQSEVESCKKLFDEPDDADELAACMDTAKNDYEACIKDCEEDSASTGTPSSDSWT